MYDVSKLVHANHITVEELIDHLKTLPQKAVITCCGDEYMFIHVEKDESAVTIDTEDLSEDYYAFDSEFPEYNEIPKIGGSLHRDMIQVRYYPDEDELDRIKKHSFYKLLIPKSLYWCERNSFENNDLEIIDIYKGVYTKDEPFGTVNKRYLVATGNIYNYNNKK